MKKFLAIICVVILSVTAVVALAACGPKTEVEKAIAEAEKMSLADLEKAAQEEFEALGEDFVAQATTSGVGKSLTKFAEKYTWFKYAKFSSSKDNVAYQALDQTVAQGNFWADMTMIQIASNLKSYVDNGVLYNYVPKNDDEIALDKKATEPLVGLYADKLFVYNKKSVADGWELKNIWQLTGQDGKDLKKAAAVSFQDPNTEGINMSFLTSMTSDEAVAKLKTAYKNYFGEDYKKTDDCKNIGYHFVEQFVKNCVSHDSDTKVLSTYIAKDAKGTVYVVGLNKTKDYATPEGSVAGVTGNWYEDLWYAGVHGDVEGYNGYTYNTYLSVPSTTRLPYTACLFIRYILTEEGFRAGWKDVGYSCPNTKVTPNVDSKAKDGGYEYKLDTAKVLQEKIEWTAKAAPDVRKFVAANWNK